MCEAECTVWGMPDRLVPGTVRFYPKPRTFGNCLVVVHVGAPYRAFRFTLKVINQEIVGLSPLFETA
jgi:hypothetical protein